MLIVVNKKTVKLCITFLLVILALIFGFIIFNPNDDSEVFNNYEYTVDKPIDRGDKDSNYIALALNPEIY